MGPPGDPFVVSEHESVVNNRTGERPGAGEKSRTRQTSGLSIEEKRVGPYCSSDFLASAHRSTKGARHDCQIDSREPQGDRTSVRADRDTGNRRTPCIRLVRGCHDRSTNHREGARCEEARCEEADHEESGDQEGGG